MLRPGNIDFLSNNDLTQLQECTCLAVLDGVDSGFFSSVLGVSVGGLLSCTGVVTTGGSVAVAGGGWAGAAVGAGFG